MSNRIESNSRNTVHPICLNSTDPEKCAAFVEMLGMFDLDMEPTNHVVGRIESGRKSKTA